MKGLLLKDLYMTMKYCRSYLLIAVVFTAVSFVGNDNLFFIFYPCPFCGMIPVTLLGYDERSHWQQYRKFSGCTREVEGIYLLLIIFVGRLVDLYAVADGSHGYILRGASDVVEQIAVCSGGDLNALDRMGGICLTYDSNIFEIDLLVGGTQGIDSVLVYDDVD